MKKILTIFLSLVLLTSVCSVKTLASDGDASSGDVNLIYGTSASGENWIFDGSTLTLSGANINGNVIFSCGDTRRDISVLTTADSTVSGDIFAIFDNYSYSVNYTFTSKNNAIFNLGGGLSGGSNNNETLSVDSANVVLGGINLGASGAADSNIAVEKGGKLTVNNSVTIQNISLSGASEFKINAIGSYSDSALMGNSAFTFSMDETSSIFLYGNIMAIGAESADYDFADFKKFLPAGVTLKNYDENHTTLVDKNGDYVTKLIMGAAAVSGITENHKVYVKTENSTVTPDVYSVDVAWGAMEFTYTVKGSKDWNVDECRYTDNFSASWSQTGNTVSVTNHSNKAVTASFGFVKDSSITDDVRGSFDVTSKLLDAGIVGEFDKADKVISTLTIDGVLGSEKTTFTKVGVVTVTIQ